LLLLPPRSCHSQDAPQKGRDDKAILPAKSCKAVSLLRQTEAPQSRHSVFPHPLSREQGCASHLWCPSRGFQAPGPTQFSFHNSECSLQPSDACWEATRIRRLGGDPLRTRPPRHCLPPTPRLGAQQERWWWCRSACFRPTVFGALKKTFPKRSCTSCLLPASPL